jgi:hypothetical protein
MGMKWGWILLLVLMDDTLVRILVFVEVSLVQMFTSNNLIHPSITSAPRSDASIFSGLIATSNLSVYAKR